MQRHNFIFKGRTIGNNSVTLDLQDMLKELVNLGSVDGLHRQEN
jgi:hypothetical protein